MPTRQEQQDSTVVHEADGTSGERSGSVATVLQSQSNDVGQNDTVRIPRPPSAHKSALGIANVSAIKVTRFFDNYLH